jgi:hypothetical protein
MAFGVSEWVIGERGTCVFMIERSACDDMGSEVDGWRDGHD